MATLFASDSHFGLDLPNAERITEEVGSIVEKGKFGCRNTVFAGDLVVGWKQQNENPGWQQRLQNDAGAWVDLLRKEHATVIAGNCEHQPEIEILKLGQLGYASYDEKSGVFVTHGHIAEPRSAIELIRNLPPAILQQFPGSRKAMERVLGTRNEACFDTKGTSARLEQAVKKDPALQSALENIDKGNHQSSASLYFSLARIANLMPGIRKSFDSLVRLSLDDYYIRMLVHSVRELVKSNVIAPPRTVLYGHTHRAFIRNKSQLQQSFDFGEGWLPQYIVNSGTMVPLGERNGGTDDSHCVMVRDQIPELWRTTNAPIIELVNIGGEKASQTFDAR